MTDQAPMKRCGKCGEQKSATPEFFHRKTCSKDGLQSWCKGCAATYHEAYHAANREVRSAARRHWYLKNRESTITNKIAKNKRRRKSRVLWETYHRQFARAWWGHQCAYCGSDWQPTKHGLQKGRGFDHFRPLSQGGVTLPSNMLPACPDCNNSKHVADPRAWLTRRFGETVAQERLAKIAEYFAAVREKFGEEIDAALAKAAEAPAVSEEVAAK